MNAYDKSYLEKARAALGRMLDFAVNELYFDLENFWTLFLVSGISTRFGEGDFSLLVGKSGVELAFEVLEKSGISIERGEVHYTPDRSCEYWTGWSLAYYQWKSCLTFSEITKYVPISRIQSLYSPYHEMDIRQFCDEMEKLYRLAKTETNLKILRKASGLSQQNLADLSGVSVRTIQQYEQRKKDINKAGSDHLRMLSRALQSDMESLLETDTVNNISPYDMVSKKEKEQEK